MVGLRTLRRLILGITFFANASAFAQSGPPPVVVKPPKASAPAVQAKAAKPPTPPAKPDLLFEGYSRIMLGQTHIGYTIQRFEYDPRKKEYSTVYYLKTQPPANDVIESLKARSSFDLQPLSYQYTALESGKVRIVDASFNNGVMSISSLEGGKRKALPPRKINKGTFLASFLGYLMLQQKDGVKVGNKYSYEAIAEEDGNVYKGDAYVKQEETIKTLQTFRILNTYKNVKFVSNFTPKGEVVATHSDAQDISTELVANIQDATKGMSVNSNQLKQLFDEVPKGQENAVAKHAPGQALGGEARAEGTELRAGNVVEPKTKTQILEATPVPTGAKGEGIKGGQGITIKPEQSDE